MGRIATRGVSGHDVRGHGITVGSALPRPGVETTAASAPAGRGWRSILRGVLTPAGAALALALWLAPAPAGLTAEGKAACAVFVLCGALWVSHAIPVGLTGLLAVALLGLTGAMPAADAFAAFGNSAIFFILGVFILAAALIEAGVSKRLALLFLVRFGRSPYAFATGIMLAGVVATAWMPAQATVAVLYPITLEVAAALRLRPGTSSYGKVLFLSLAWGAMVGSNASFLGSTRAPLALGMLWSGHGATISFGRWLLAALPLVLAGLLVMPLVLRLCYRREAIDGDAARAALAGAVAEMGPLQWRQIRVAAIALITVLAWIAVGGRVDLAIIALLGGAAAFTAGGLRWPDVDGHIHWSVILMYGGAVAIGIAIDRTGAGAWLGALFLGGHALPAYLAVVGLALATLALSELMSNAAAVAVMLPIGFGLGDQLLASPEALVLAASIGGGLAFTLPISSAPNAIAFASGYLRMSDFIRTGAIMTAVQIVLLLLLVRFWWPAIGIL